MFISFYPQIKKIYINMQKGFIGGGLLFLLGCSGHEKSEQQRLREQNAKGEYIYRYHDEKQYTLSPPIQRKRPLYPWERKEIAQKEEK